MEGGDTDGWVDVVIAERCDLLDDLLGDALRLLDSLQLTTLSHDLRGIVIFIGLLVDRLLSGIRGRELHGVNKQPIA